jgi:proteasome lid subunit RPN8/RPN11
VRGPADEEGNVEIPAQIYEAMISHSRFTYPEEGCGLLAADQTGRLRMVYCLTNAERSESSYTIEPTEHFRALQHAESRGWELVGAFHSHPHSPAFPSVTDLRLAAEPDWIYLVIGLSGPPELRGFHLRGGTVDEVVLRILD